MYLINFFMLRKKTPANIAKNRLKILISSKQDQKKNIPHYFPELKRDLIAVICKYVQIKSEKISIQFETKKSNNAAILSLNITVNTKKH